MHNRPHPLLARLLLAAAGAVSASCGLAPTSSTDGCGDSAPPENCAPRDQVWLFVQQASGAAGASAGGASGTGGAASSAGAAGSTSQGCPTRELLGDKENDFMRQFGFIGSQLGEVQQKGENCCYKTVIICEGRPLWVDDELRGAPLRRKLWG